MIHISYPLVNKQFAIENGPVEIVDLPSYKARWIFPSSFGTVYQRVSPLSTIINHDY